MFKWGAQQNLVPAIVVAELKLLEPLRKGRSLAVERAPVQPASENDVAAALPFMRPPVAAMCRLQMLTAMRPGEACDQAVKEAWEKYKEAAKKKANLETKKGGKKDAREEALEAQSAAEKARTSVSARMARTWPPVRPNTSSGGPAPGSRQQGLPGLGTHPLRGPLLFHQTAASWPLPVATRRFYL